MKRLIESKLFDWKNRKDKMPLLIYGARQVGKTTTIFNFGKTNYANTVVFNFENNEPLATIFDKDLNPIRIIIELERLSGQSITKGSTLVFFDEVQACPNALTSLKYFCEQAPDYHIIAAGSLLGVALSFNKNKGKDNDDKGKGSFPIGKVEILTMYPMTFEEFLITVNPHLLNAVKECYAMNLPLLQPLHEKALELYRNYLFIGGMPKAVLEYIEKQDYDFVRIRQSEILSFYSADMAKYTTQSEQRKITTVYNSIPTQLARENKKFQYSLIGSNARAATYEIGLTWLKSAGLVLNCHKAREGKMPLAYYSDLSCYKIYMSDVGLLNAKGNAPKSLVLADELSGEAKGAMTENYVAQELTANGHIIYYWESNGKAEVDFVIQLNDCVIPVEVKSADNVQSKSLKQYVEKYTPAYSIRISGKNFGFTNGIKSIPLYAVFCIV
ncbi:MAG: ATP-binding protein [Christensenellaceae bacterium]|jgi:predicted AAA+ superfamily ATPase|nr:ATP-binding protein [Christensenellaceae bacterium]